MVTVLSIDGGGIRGIIPSLILHEIRRRLTAAGKKQPLSDFFDIIAGTSTGALIAFGLAYRDKEGRPYSTTDIIDMYERRGSEIFPLSYHNAFHTAVQAFRHKYPVSGIERVLHETFGDATMKDSAASLLVTSFDTEAMRPLCMKNRPRHPEWPSDYNYLMRDAARASSAAPTFFPPARISPVDKPEINLSLIDGAVFANNPAGLAYVEVKKVFPRASEFFVLSLGTGTAKRGFSYNEIHDWGYMEWVNPLKGFPIGTIMSAGQSEVVSHQLRRIDEVKYIRINASLNKCSPSMDDAGKKNLRCLKETAERAIEENDAEIDVVCKVLQKKMGPLRFFRKN